MVLDDITPPDRPAEIARALVGKTDPRSTRELASGANTRGYRLYQQGKLDDALPLFVVAAELDHGYGMPRYNAARILALRGDLPGALKWLQELKAMGRSQRVRLAETRKDVAFKKIWDAPDFAALQPEEPKTAAPPAAAVPSDAIVILDRAGYGVTQLPKGDLNGSWATVCKETNDFVLRPVAVNVVAVHDKIADESPGDKNGRDVRVNGCQHSVLLVRGLSTPRPRVLVSASIRLDGAGAAKKAVIRFGDETYEMMMLGENDTAQVVLQKNGGIRQTLVASDPDAAAETTITDWKLRWAGDLDGDGRLDLILENEDERTEVRLFLSTGAKALVREAAFTYYGGC